MVFKLVLPFLLILSTLQARENPFFPLNNETDMSYTSNEDFNYPPFKQASIVLPSSARVIKKVTIEYEMLDASTQTKTIEINNEIDWHLPIFISQSYTNIKHKNEKLESILKEPVVTKTHRKRRIKRTVIRKKEKTLKKSNFKKIASFHKDIFLVKEKTIKLVTKNKIIRNFLLVKPHRIVLDLDADIKMKSFNKVFNKSIFKSIRIGDHKGYYRVVIELDGLYTYSTKKLKDGYSFTLQ